MYADEGGQHPNNRIASDGLPRSFYKKTMTSEHPYQVKIHYATGGVVDHVKHTADFSTLCGRHYRQGHSEIMQSGHYGAQQVTCKACRVKLDKIERERQHRERVQNLIAQGRYDRLIIKKA